MPKLFLAVLLFVAAPAHAWNEPDSFMGIKFFTDITKSLKKCQEVLIGGKPFEGHYDHKQGICWVDKGDYHKIHNAEYFTLIKALTSFKSERQNCCGLDVFYRGRVLYISLLRTLMPDGA